MIKGNVPTVYTVANYLADLRAIHLTGSATAETSYHPPVSALFNAAGQSLTPTVLFSTQLSDIGAGLPDGGRFSSAQAPAAATSSPAKFLKSYPPTTAQKQSTAKARASVPSPSSNSTSSSNKPPTKAIKAR